MVNKNFPLVSTNTSDKDLRWHWRFANARTPDLPPLTGNGIVRRRGPPPPQDCRARNRLLIIADATAEISVGPGYEAYLRNERIIGAGLWAHIADLGDLTVRLLNRRIDFHAKRSARRVLSGAYVHAKRSLEVGIARCNDRAIAGADTKHVEVSIRNPPSPLLNISSALASSALTAATAFISMARASSAVPPVC